MQSKLLPAVLVLVLILIASGCSKSSSNPVAPSDSGIHSQSDSSPSVLSENRFILGVWSIRFDTEKNDIFVEPVRDLSGHFNATNFLLGPQCLDCLLVSVNSYDPTTNIVDVDLSIKNPHTAPVYDVRCIGLTYDHPEVPDYVPFANADDWIDIYDVDGGDPNGLNPFIAFNKEEVTHSRMIAPNMYATENILWYLPPWSEIHIAIDVSLPGNCSEPYEISNFNHEELDETTGSSAGCSVDVFDWQVDDPENDVEYVKLSIPDLMNDEIVDLALDSDNTWIGTIFNNNGVEEGEYKGLIEAFSPNGWNISLYDYVVINVGPGCAEPTNVNASQGNYPDKVVITWSSPDPRPSQYEIHWREEGAFDWETSGCITVGDPDNPSYDAYVDQCEQNYEFQVRSCCNGDFSEWVPDPPVIGWNSTPICPEPANVIASQGSYFDDPYQVLLSWDKQPDVDSYAFRFRKLGESAWENESQCYAYGENPNQKCNINDPCALYEFQVKSCCNNSESAWAPEPPVQGWAVCCPVDNPTVDCQWSIPEYGHGIDVEGDYVYVCTGNGGNGNLIIFDKISCTTPIVSINIGHYAESIDVQDNHAFIAAHDGLVVFDVSDVFNPQYCGMDPFATPDDLVVEGDYAYVAGSYGVRKEDISDPCNPYMPGDGYYTEGYASRGVDVQGEYLYVARYDDPECGLHIYDKNDLRVKIGSCWPLVDTIYGMDVEGNYAYITMNTTFGLALIDVSDPTAPVRCPDYLGGMNWAMEVDVEGCYAYVADLDGLHVVDVSDPCSAVTIHDFPFSISTEVKVDGDYAYVANQHEYTRIKLR